MHTLTLSIISQYTAGDLEQKLHLLGSRNPVLMKTALEQLESIYDYGMPSTTTLHSRIIDLGAIEDSIKAGMLKDVVFALYMFKNNILLGGDIDFVLT